MLIGTRGTIRCLTGFCMPQTESLSLLIKAFHAKLNFNIIL